MDRMMGLSDKVRTAAFLLAAASASAGIYSLGNYAVEVYAGNGKVSSFQEMERWDEERRQRRRENPLFNTAGHKDVYQSIEGFLICSGGACL